MEQSAVCSRISGSGLDEESTPIFILYNCMLWTAIFREITFRSSRENSLCSNYAAEELSVRITLSIFASTPLILEARGCYRYMHYNLCRFSSQYEACCIFKMLLQF